MSDGTILLTAATIVACIFVPMYLTLDVTYDNREDIIDLKTHTHASDGSINGIRGWY